MEESGQRAAEPKAAGSPPSPGSTRWLVLGLVAWSLFVWATRIDNIVSDVSLTTAGQIGRLALSASFVVLAVLVGWRWRRQGGPAGRSWVVEVLAWWTIAVWIVRGSGIVLSDHDVGFIIVHVVLAIMSIVLAALVLRAVSDRTSLPR